MDIKDFHVWKVDCFSKPSFLWWQTKVESTIPIILVVTITVKQPAASAQAPRWHLYRLLDVEFGACLIPCSTTSCASIATIKGGVDAAVDLYSCWTAKAWQMATSRLHDESAKNKDAPPSHPRDWREFSRHSIWFDYPPPVRAKPHVKPSSSVAPSSVVPPKPSVAPNLKQPSMDDSQVEYHCCIECRWFVLNMDFQSFLPSKTFLTPPTASTPKMEKKNIQSLCSKLYIATSHDLIPKAIQYW